MTVRPHVAVVGAGIAGLTAALDLVRAGYAVTVIEAAAVAGGKLRTADIAGLSVDVGAEAYLRRRPEVSALADSVGLTDAIVGSAEVPAQIWTRSGLRRLPARTLIGLPSSVASMREILTPRERGRAALDRILPGSPPTEDLAVGAWARRRVGAAVVEWLVDPLLGGVYSGRADTLSLFATVPQLGRSHSSLLAGVAAALPSLTASSGPTGPVFGSVRGGLGRLATAVADASVAGGATLITGRPVRELSGLAGGGWRLVHGATADAAALDVDAVVLAVPASPAAKLLHGVAPRAAAELAAIESASVAIVTTAWRPQQAPDRASSGYLIPAVAGRPAKAVTLSSTKWPHLAVDDVALARVSFGRAGEIADLQRDDDDLARLATDELTTVAGFTGRPLHTLVTRWGGGLPQYAVGHLDRVARIRAAVAEHPGLAVAGGLYDGVGVPACIGTGHDAARRVQAWLSSR